MAKMCSKCKIEKEPSGFHKCAKNTDKLQRNCKICRAKYHTDNRDKILSVGRKYYSNNKEKESERKKKYLTLNRDKVRAMCKSYRLKNKEKISERAKKYRLVNADKIKKYRKENKDKLNIYFKNKRRDDIQRKMSGNLRRRIHKAIKNNYKAGSAVRDLGCSVDFLKKHLEDKFQKGMSWENYGLHGWHIDHIRPLSSFNLENREEFLEACNYSNLQPLWAKDNLSKGSKLDWKKEQSLLHKDING